MSDQSRRGFLGTVGAAVGAALMGPGVASAEPIDRQFIVDTDDADRSIDEVEDLKIIHDLREYIGYAVVRGPESSIPSSTYVQDVEMEQERPVFEADPDLDLDIDLEAEAEVGTEGALYDFQWDKREQRLTEVHSDAIGDGARIGIIDSGVIGTGEYFPAHTDLPNVNPTLSLNLTPDGLGPGPFGGYHGTAVAGTAAGVGFGVVGMAPGAEIVSLRVFPNEEGGTGIGNTLAAVVVGASPEEEEVPVNFWDEPFEDGETDPPSMPTGADCDVLNMSLGFPPLVPFEDPAEAPFSDDDPYVAVPPDLIELLDSAYSSAAQYALDNGTLVIASAGNDGVNLSASVNDRSQNPDYRYREVDAKPHAFPAEASGVMSVGATGPIGYGWPVGSDPDSVLGFSIESEKESSLPASEPAVYTNYGADAVDVTAGGGNYDTDTFSSSGRAEFPGAYDLLATTSVDYEEFGGTYTWTAGTSFSAPNVTGLAALLFDRHPGASPQEIRAHIEETAELLLVGDGGTTTAPGAKNNESGDREGVGDSPGRDRGDTPYGSRFRPETYRGEGHISAREALTRPLSPSRSGGESGSEGGEDGVTEPGPADDSGRDRRRGARRGRRGR